MNETHNPRFIAIKRDKGYAGSYIDLNCLEPCDLAFDEYVIYSRDDANKEMLDAKDAKLAEYKASHARLVKALETLHSYIHEEPAMDGKTSLKLAFGPKNADQRKALHDAFEALAEAKALTGEAG